MADRLATVLRRFECAVDLGTPTDAARRALAASGKVDTVIAADALAPALSRTSSTAGDRALAVVICLFSVAFPSLKLVLLHLAAYGGKAWEARVPGWFRMLSNWSMLDVVLVALVIFAAKTSGLATAAAKPGLWFFAASALLTAAASALARRAG